jgi:hypothetical protein
MDPNSQSNITTCITRHISLDLEANFERKVLHGSVKLTVEALADQPLTQVVVDTNHLNIFKVSDANGNTLKVIISRIEKSN